MKEQDFTIYDEVSELPIHALDDNIIRKMAEASEVSYEEIYNKYKEIVKDGVKYFVSYNKKEVVVITKKAMFKCPGKYFEDFEEAKIHLAEII